MERGGGGVKALGSFEFKLSYLLSSEVTTDPESDADDIQVEVNYEPDPTDLVLSSVPGGELFDPRKHKFTDEDLKPQPMIKKAKKIFVPEEQKVRNFCAAACCSAIFGEDNRFFFVAPKHW